MNPEETTAAPAQAARRTAPKFRVSRDQIKLERNIPPPEAAIPNLTGRATYPVANLEVGTSFSFPAPPRHRLGMLKSVHSAIGSHIKNHPEKQFVARVSEEEGVVRVWRIEDKTDGGNQNHPATTCDHAPAPSAHNQNQAPNPGIHSIDEEAAPPAGAVPISHHEIALPGEEA